MNNAKKIGEYCDVGDGAHASIGRVDNGIPYLTSKNFGSTGIKLDKLDYISESDFNKYFRENSKALTKPKIGDLIFSIIGSIGGAHLYGETDNFGLSSSVAIIRPDSNILASKYLLYYLKSEYLQKWVESIKSGSAQGFLSLEMIRNLPLILPELPIQQKIASILSNYDDLIENNNKRIQLLEEMAEEIYKEWFVRLRFPGHENTVFIGKEGNKVDRETDGALPEGWEVVRIKNIGKVITGKTPSKKVEDYFGADIPFIKTPDMSQGLFFIKTDESLSIKGANSQMNQYVPENSICISCIGTVGKIGLTITKSQTNQQINSLIPKQKAQLEYLYFTLLRMRPMIESYAATGATMANLSKSKFENLRLAKPSSILINDFHEIVNPIFGEIKILLQKNQVLQETRDLLLPRLISGKLSVAHLLETENIHMAAEPQTTYSTK